MVEKRVDMQDCVRLRSILILMPDRFAWGVLRASLMNRSMYFRLDAVGDGLQCGLMRPRLTWMSVYRPDFASRFSFHERIS